MVNATAASALNNCTLLSRTRPAALAQPAVRRLGRCPESIRAAHRDLCSSARVLHSQDRSPSRTLPQTPRRRYRPPFALREPLKRVVQQAAADRRGRFASMCAQCLRQTTRYGSRLFRAAPQPARRCAAPADTQAPEDSAEIPALPSTVDCPPLQRHAIPRPGSQFRIFEPREQWVFARTRRIFNARVVGISVGPNRVTGLAHPKHSASPKSARAFRFSSYSPLSKASHSSDPPACA